MRTGIRPSLGLALSTMTVGAWLMAVPALARDEATPVPSMMETAMLPAALGAVDTAAQTATLPRVLSHEDEQSYREVFRLQEAGNWKAADQILHRIGDPLLMGHVLAQRYLASGYKASPDELTRWMEAYGDHPDAPTIYQVAVQKAGRKGAGSVPRPVTSFLFGDGDGVRWDGSASGAYKGLSERDRHQVESLKARFRQLLNDGDTRAARGLLDGQEARRLLHRADLDQMESLLSFAYFTDGRDDLALEAAGRSSAHDADAVPLAHWTAGLAAWRQGKLDAARGHFESLAKNPRSSGWMVAAGGYWAARANLKTRHPEGVNQWLTIAAGQPRTFYGLLARRALGLEIHFDWDAAHLSHSDLGLLTESPTGRRALGLIQAGQSERAERQLRKVYPNASDAEARAVIALAQQANMPALAISLAGGERRANGNGKKDRTFDAAQYPVPAWSPNGGWRIDKALVLAFVRQESAFNPVATSPAGAAGLMQLLPSTASFIAKNSGKGEARSRALYEPETNLMLGQRYLEHLLEDADINGNLLYMIAAYNWGPGNLAKWVKSNDMKDDPLLFMESIPVNETRLFVERVLTNFWMYRMRLNQPTPSLDALASGDWPMYVQLDTNNPMVAANVAP